MNIEQQALALVNEVKASPGHYEGLGSVEWDHLHEALLAAIERHEAFRQEVSRAASKVVKEVSNHYCGNRVSTHISRFIIEPPVDPIKECLAVAYGSAPEEFVGAFKEALAKRGLQITGATP